MTANELRNKYIEFFKSRGHTQIQGKSLMPENDPTVLFTTAGMHPLVPFILGEKHPAGERLVNFQKCIRTGDIEEVGNYSHLTFFEMLGNWSLGNYFKDEAIKMSFEFLTSPEWLGIPIERLGVTVFIGDQDAPRDNESASIWRELGIPEDRISFLPKEDNWWGPAGMTGPCGPDTEMFYYIDEKPCSPECKPGCSCNKWLEIWNDVFMEYNKNSEGVYENLSRKCVDTGMGIERTITVLNGKKSVYDTEIFTPIVVAVEKGTGYKFGSDSEKDVSLRIIADHIRASAFILGDNRGILPSNLGAGYVLRRLIRRSVRHWKKLTNLTSVSFLSPIALAVIEKFKDVYPELGENRERILTEMDKEEKKFLETLVKGEQEFEKLLPNLLKNPQKIMSGRMAFRLYDTYGFPIELTEELAFENGMKVNREEFEEAYKKHQELSRAGSEQVFKGGLQDNSDAVTALHTATHLLHKALMLVLGDHIAQKGSNITAERLRFDFSHPNPMTKEEIKAVEDLVNAQIQKKYPIFMEIMDAERAKNEGAAALFGEKYEEQVKVYTIGESNSDFFSKEVCGGPHVENSGLLGKFIIQKEQSSSAGVRRIRAVLE